jgi:hypothetical protein
MTAQSGELTLEIKCVLPAARSVVFGLQRSGRAGEVVGAGGLHRPGLEFNPRVGDGYRIEMQPPEGDPFYLIGEFREVDPPARLAYTFVWEDPDPDDVETLVELSFRDLGESTEVVLAQGPSRPGRAANSTGTAGRTASTSSSNSSRRHSQPATANLPRRALWRMLAPTAL